MIDLSDVEFMDTAGLGVLVEEWNAVQQSGGRLCLVARQGPLKLLLEVAGLSELLDFCAELEGAVGSCTLAPA